MRKRKFRVRDYVPNATLTQKQADDVHEMSELLEELQVRTAMRSRVRSFFSRAGGRGCLHAVLTDIAFPRVAQDELEITKTMLASERAAFGDKLKREFNDDANLERLLESDSGRQNVVRAIAALTATGIREDLSTDAEKNIEEDDIADYTHESFVANRVQHGGGLLVEYLSAVMHNLSSGTAASSSAAATAPSTTLGKRVKRGAAQAIAAMYSAVDPSFRWAYAVGRNVVFRSALTDPFLQDVEYDSVPGGYSRSGLRYVMDKWCKNVKYTYPEDKDVLITMDNVGRYRQGSSRVGLTHRVAVVANGLVNTLKKGTERMLQGTYTLSPALYQPWNVVPENLMDVEDSRRDGERQSEREYLEDEIDTYIHEQLEHVIAGCKRRDDGTLEDGLVEEAKVRPEPVPGARRERDPYTKVCKRCLHQNEGSKQKCFACDHGLPTKKEMEQEKRLTAGGIEEVFPEAAPRRYQKTTQVVRGVSFDDSGRKIEDAGVELDALRDEFPDQIVETMQLPVVPVNPNTTTAIKHVMDRYYQLLGLRGYTKESVTPAREWLIVVRDEGATESKSEENPRVLSLLGSGHEEQVYIKRLCKIAFELGGDFLCKVLGFTDKAAEVIFANAKHPHKPWQMLMLVFRPVVTRAFVREFLQDSNVDDQDRSAEGFRKWLQGHPRQLLARFFVLREVPALACFRAAVRRYRRCEGSGDPLIHARTFTAARKVLHPLLWSRNAPRYAPAVLREMATVQFRMPAPVRRLVECFQSHMGQGWDWKMENGNRRLKRSLSGANTRRTWTIGAMLLDFTERCRVALAKAAGRRDVDHETATRTLPDLEPVMRRMEKLIYQARWLELEGESDSVVPRPLDKSKMLAASALRYYEDGDRLMRDAIQDLRNTEGLKTPLFRVKAKWTAVGESETIDSAPTDERDDLEEEPNEEEMMELQDDYNQDALEFLGFEEGGEEGTAQGDDEGSE